MSAIFISHSSKDSMASQWCFAESTHAKALGKQIFPIKIGDITIKTVLTSRQVMVNKEDAYQRLLRGLKVAGLDPTSSFNWDGSRAAISWTYGIPGRRCCCFFRGGCPDPAGIRTLKPPPAIRRGTPGTCAGISFFEIRGSTGLAKYPRRTETISCVITFKR